MASIVDVTRAIKGVTTAPQGLRIVNDAIAEVGSAQKTGNIPTDLANSKRDLEALKKRIGNASMANFPEVWESGKGVISKAYVNIAGAMGEFQARESVSLMREFERAAKEAPSLIGQTVGELAGGVGNVGGSLVGGILRGLGPLVVVVLGIVIYFRYAKK